MSSVHKAILIAAQNAAVALNDILSCAQCRGLSSYVQTVQNDRVFKDAAGVKTGTKGVYLEGSVLHD